MERLQKFLSRAGVASRRHAEAMIVDGRVKVNGKIVTVLGTQVDASKDLVLLDGKLVAVNPERKYFLFYKPPGVVTTLSDPEGRPTVGDYAKDVGSRVFPVGRLDYDAEGALLLTDDGDLANKLMHPSHQVPRVYLAKVKGVPDEASLAKLVEGVRLEDGMAHAVQAQIFEKAERNTWVKIVVTEGRQHLVKRLCAAIGHPVVRLYRPAHAGLPVHGLKPGELRALSNDEIRRVKAAADGDAQPEPRLTLPARRHGHAAPGFEPEEDTRPEGRRTKGDDRPARVEAQPEREDHEQDDEELEEPSAQQEETDAPPARSARKPQAERSEPREPRKPFVGRPSALEGGERKGRFGVRDAVSGYGENKPRSSRAESRNGSRDEGGRDGAKSRSSRAESRGGGRDEGGRDGANPRSFRAEPRGGGRDEGGRDGAKPRSSRAESRDGGRSSFGGVKKSFGAKKSFGSRDEGGRDGGKRSFGAKKSFGSRDGGSSFGARATGGRDGGKRFGRNEGGRDEGGGKRFGNRDEGGAGRRSGGRSESREAAPGRELSKPFPGERGYGGSSAPAAPRASGERVEGAFGRKRQFSGPPRGEAGEGSRRDERPRSRFGGAGGPRSDGARGFGDPGTRIGERASGPRRTGPGAKTGGFKKPGGFKKGGFKGGRKGPGGAGGGRSSPRKPRGSW